MTEKRIESVSAECIIYYTDGNEELCPHAPLGTFEECGPGYGPGGDCPKWEFRHPLKGEDVNDLR